MSQPACLTCSLHLRCRSGPASDSFRTDLLRHHGLSLSMFLLSSSQQLLGCCLPRLCTLEAVSPLQLLLLDIGELCSQHFSLSAGLQLPVSRHATAACA